MQRHFILLFSIAILGSSAASLWAQQQPMPGFDPATGPGPAGVWAFINEAKAATRTGPDALSMLWKTADTANVNETLAPIFAARGPMSEVSPPLLIRESLRMVTADVAFIDAEIGRFAIVGWQGAAKLWIVLERRGESWQPVLVRAYPQLFPVPSPRTQFI